MTIKTSPFSGWRLSGDDVILFLEKSAQHRIDTKIIAFIKKGKKLSDEYVKSGFVTIDPKAE